MNKTLLLAHRGFSGKYPENTEVAFSAAINESKCDGFESDVHLTSDNEPIIIHDPTLDRTTSGKGPVAAKTFKELRQLDCGSYYDARFSGQRLMHFDELLELCLKHNLVLNLEIKNYQVFYKNIEEIIINRIKAYKATDRVFLSSFNHDSMRICKNIAPEIKTGLLYESPMLDAELYAKKYGMDAIHPKYRCLYYEPNLVKKAHDIGLAVHTWTVNEEEDMRYCLEQKLDSVITNFPDLFTKLT